MAAQEDRTAVTVVFDLVRLVRLAVFMVVVVVVVNIHLALAQPEAMEIMAQLELYGEQEEPIPMTQRMCKYVS